MSTLRHDLKAENMRTYFSLHAAQLPALGVEGQERLRDSRVHVSGTGRIGSWVALQLAAAGVGHVSANDPQVVEPENLGSWVFARTPDLGRPKVHVIERFLHGRPDVVFEPVVAPAESDGIDPFVEKADLVVSCANTLEGRLAAEQKAIRCGKPTIQVAAFDGRERLGGLMALRLPENDWSACFGCYFADKRGFPRGEGLLSTVTSTLAAVASNLAVQLLTGVRADVLKQQNLFLVDLDNYSIEPLAIRRRKDCKICAGR